MGRETVPPSFPMYVDDFASDGKVEAMTTEEVGAYFLLLLKAWREEPPGSIPNNDVVLARWARLTPDGWAECRSAVLAAFVLGADSRYHQKRMRLEFNIWRTNQKKRSEAARIAALSRWGPDDMPDGCEPHSNGNADASTGHVVVSETGKGKLSGKEGELASKVMQVFVYWQEVMKHSHSILTKKRKGKIRARLEEKFTVEQLKCAIDGCFATDFNMGRSDDGRVFDDIELICRDAEHVERFIATAGRINARPNSNTQPNPVTADIAQAAENYRGANVKQIGDSPSSKRV
jgi:uncharacterized phage protein (TIGR02220 family)